MKHDEPAEDAFNREREAYERLAKLPCITRVGESQGRPFVAYLRDGTKITIGRDGHACWLIISNQLQIKPA